MAINSIPLAIMLADIARLQQRLPRALAEKDMAQAGSIAKGARSRGEALSGVHGHAAPGIKAVNQAPIVRLFGDEHPEVFGAEFGGGRRPTTRQFPPWRGKGEEAGYMLYPEIRERLEGEKYEDEYFEVVQKYARF